MCFFARTDYKCGDFKWGNLKQRCERQPRIGEVCGAKLLDQYSLTHVNEDCRVCQDIDTKRRRLAKEQSNITRWKVDTKNSFHASIEKAERESHVLRQQIGELTQRRSVVKLSKGGVTNPGESKARMRPASGNSCLETGSRHEGHGKESRESDRHAKSHLPSLPYRTSNPYGGHGNNRHAP